MLKEQKAELLRFTVPGWFLGILRKSCDKKKLGHGVEETLPETQATKSSSWSFSMLSRRPLKLEFTGDTVSPSTSSSVPCCLSPKQDINEVHGSSYSHKLHKLPLFWFWLCLLLTLWLVSHWPAPCFILGFLDNIMDKHQTTSALCAVPPVLFEEQTILILTVHVSILPPWFFSYFFIFLFSYLCSI